jgi:hypothetical protein
MRLIRVQHSARKTVIYHPSFGDVMRRVRCLFGVHRYETVLEYASVGAKEELCMHCMKARYSIERSAVAQISASKSA